MNSSVEAKGTDLISDLCVKAFDIDTDVQTQIHTDEKKFSCDVCGKAFLKKSHFHEHYRIHTKEKPFSCEECGREFAQKCNLNCHYRTHSTFIDGVPYKASGAVANVPNGRKKRIMCDACGKIFSRKSDFDNHYRTHTKEKPYSCDVCSRRFCEKGSLKRHHRTHTNEKPYSCCICKKKFSDKGNLNKHHRYHTDEKPYSCYICSKGFAQKSHLNKHIQIHAKQKHLVSGLNNGTFYEKKNLLNQSSQHTNENLCMCDTSVKDPLNKHFLNSSDNKSNNRYFIHKSRLTNSDQTSGNPIQIGEKTFVCGMCGKSFTRQDNLRKHYRLYCKGEVTPNEII